ncbi:hypothetical protein F2Q69_00032689 [Brassica cretica]|uniref:Uncharacterized protein n=1 Tax=Brassica cretica TaxID=69181 RepID=A0A8S9SIM1_BRACR|nr:hypothetical protein F2Q69_00032689 [Brassica cretica]
MTQQQSEKAKIQRGPSGRRYAPPRAVQAGSKQAQSRRLGREKGIDKEEEQEIRNNFIQTLFKDLSSYMP